MAAGPVVAVLGTGAMGAPMARNLLRAGLATRVWNRTASRAEPLAGDGATVCPTPLAATEPAEVLVTMLADGPAVAAAVEGALRPGLLWLQTSTVGIDWASRLEALAAGAGAQFVDAPVLGSRAAAEAGELTVLASGAPAALERARPVFEAVGARILGLGDAGAGTRLKLVFNFWILGQTAVGAETLSLADALQVGAERFLELVRGGFADAPYVQAKAPLLLGRDHPASFRLELGRKDAALALEAGRAAGLELDVGAAVVEELGRAVARGYGDADIAAVIEAVRPGSA